jgi:hypothetical protein
VDDAGRVGDAAEGDEAVEGLARDLELDRAVVVEIAGDRQIQALGAEAVGGVARASVVVGAPEVVAVAALALSGAGPHARARVARAR